MGKRNGRVCLLNYDISELELEYNVTARGRSTVGKVVDTDDFYSIAEDILDIFSTTKIEVALKHFRAGSINGICIKSFPATLFTLQLLTLMRLCSGGQNGNDLVILPQSGGLLDQLNFFIDAFSVYIDERSKFIAESIPQKDESHGQK
jgi:hypothetical protein